MCESALYHITTETHISTRKVRWASVFSSHAQNNKNLTLQSVASSRSTQSFSLNVVNSELKPSLGFEPPLKTASKFNLPVAIRTVRVGKLMEYSTACNLIQYYHSALQSTIYRIKMYGKSSNRERSSAVCRVIAVSPENSCINQYSKNKCFPFSLIANRYMWCCINGMHSMHTVCPQAL